jgi:hypothetical protein
MAVPTSAGDADDDVNEVTVAALTTSTVTLAVAGV